MEFGVFGDFDESLGSVEGPPMFGGGAPSGSGELEEHGQRGRSGAVAFGAAMTQADGGEGRFDRVRGSHMLPVFGREVVEGQEHVAAFLQAVGRFGTLSRARPLRAQKLLPLSQVLGNRSRPVSVSC